jgi:NAD(P) transhydrogenase
MVGGLLGKKVALVEKAALVGGAGINTGTIPSKTLRETSLMLSGWRSRRLFGVDLSLRREATVTDFMRHEKQCDEQRTAAGRGAVDVAWCDQVPRRGEFRGRTHDPDRR